jgi:glycosyltransferase involved in cell wall biosynthesis
MIPSISIIVPCYNQAQYLDECLQSVMNQTFQDWECIIVNDGSPDKTKEIAKIWTKKDIRFIYLKKVNGGISSARNAGISIAKGEFILPLDADDKINIQYVELALKEFEKDKDLTLVYCNAYRFGLKNDVLKLTPFTLQNLAKENVIFCSGIFRKIDFLKLKGYDINMVFGIEDWEFWISLLKDGAKVLKLDYFGFYYRIKLVSRQTGLSKNKKKQMVDYICIKHVNFFIQYLGNFQELENKNAFLENNLKSRKYLFTQLCRLVLGENIVRIFVKILKKIK